MTPNRLDVDINSKKIHATYMLIGYQAIFTHYWIYLGDFLQRYIKIVLLLPDLVPKGALMTPNRLCVDVTAKKIHARYMLLRCQTIFTHYWIYLGDFLQRYIKIVLFTPGFGPKRSINDP